MTVHAIPPDMHTVTPHLICDGAARAIDFYVKAFGAVDLARLPGPDGRLMHGMIRIGDSPVMLMDAYPEYGAAGPLALKGTPVVLHIYSEDVDAAIQQAVEAGARLIMPATDMFWGDRYGQVEDPFGHRWSIATHVRDVAPEDIPAAMAANPCPEPPAAA